MNNADKERAAAGDGKKTVPLVSRDTLSRREFVAGSAVVGATILLPGAEPAPRLRGAMALDRGDSVT